MTLDLNTIKERLKARREELDQVMDPTGFCATPWRVEQESMMCPPIILDKNRDVVAVDVEPEAADFIVTAPQTEDQLLKDVEALVEALQNFEKICAQHSCLQEDNTIMREALEYYANRMGSGGTAREALKKVDK